MPSFEEGDYVFLVTGSTGTYANVTESITFTLSLKNPCPTSSLGFNASPFPSASVYDLRDDELSLPWGSTESLVFNADTSADCEGLSIFFYHAAVGDLNDVFEVDDAHSVFKVKYT